MEYVKLDTAVSIRMPSEAISVLRAKAKKCNRKLRDYLRCVLLADAES